MDQALLFLLKLAWASRFKLPLLITVGFMILDLRMQLEITIETRRVRRARAMAYQRMARNNVQTDERDEDEAAEGSSDSWSTFDEESLESSDGSLQAA